MIRKLTSRKGISPILATLLLIAIAVGAVIITYAWVTTFTTTQTQQSGAVLSLENIRFYGSPTTVNNRTDVTIRNSGTSSAKIVTVYWSDLSYSALDDLTTSNYAMNPSTGVVASKSSIVITIKWGVTGSVITGNWTSGSTYYFKVVTEAGPYLEFTGTAP